MSKYAQGALLEKVNFPNDLKKLNRSELGNLCGELREFIIQVVAENGGHLGASLGVIELTVALHYVLNTPKDKLVWDVGHQAYGHKILTGRKKAFHTNRKLNGISGFPKIAESEYDAFGVGHSSTSISAVLGMAMANKLQGIDAQHVAVIGDASMQAGLAFEALNHAGVAGTDILVILNDNCMSIDPSVGALKEYLTQVVNVEGSVVDALDQINNQKGRPSWFGNYFEALNFGYFGPVDGHDLTVLIPVLEALKEVKGPKVLHVLTQKGKGYEPAEKGNPTKWHAPGLFDRSTGKILRPEKKKADKYQEVFGQTIVELAETNPNIVGITPAMPTGSSLKYFMEAYPERAFDVGIAEQHAVTFSAGLAANGALPFCAIYSTFLQRAFDSLVHDVAIQNLKVVFCVDRAGLVGADGATHHGNFDIAFTRSIPNLIVAAPMDEIELRNMLFTSQLDEVKSPMVIRYPRGSSTGKNWRVPFQEIEVGKGRVLRKGKEKLAVLSIGTMGNVVEEVLEELKCEAIEITHVDFRFVKPFDRDLLKQLALEHETLLTIEDGCLAGGFGSLILEELALLNMKREVIRLGIPDEVIEHGSQQELYALHNYGSEALKTQITIHL